MSPPRKPRLRRRQDRVRAAVSPATFLPSPKREQARDAFAEARAAQTQVH